MRARALSGGGDWPDALHGNDCCGAQQKQRGDVLRRFGGGNPSGGEACGERRGLGYRPWRTR
eukprot:5004354-Pleurochrysis_carterae.AAC.1